MTQKPKNSEVLKTSVDEWGRKKFALQQRQEREDQNQQEEVIITEQSRNRGLLVEKYIGRIQKNKKNRKREVFFCDVCNEGFKCDLAYITHLNGAQHNAKIGMSMKVKAVSPEAVLLKLQQMKKAKGSRYDQDEQMAKPQGNEKGLKQEQKEAKEQQQLLDEKQQLQGQQDSLQAQLLLYGLPTSFGKKKVKRN